MKLFSRASENGASPEESRARILELLTTLETYEQRVDGLLSEMCTLAGLPDGYLYVADEGARHLHLVQSRARPADDPTRVAPGPFALTIEGGVEASAPTPPLEILRDEQDTEDRVVPSPVGHLYSYPLIAGEDVVGLIRMGPVQGETVDRAVRARLAVVRDPITLVAVQARQEHLLREQLASVTARVEAAERLAGSALDSERMVALLLDLAMKSTRSDAGFVAIHDSASGRLELRAEDGMPDDFAATADLSPETGLFDWSLGAEVGALMLRDLEQAERFGLQSIIAVPMLEEGEPLGVFALANFGDSGTFEGESVELLATFAEQVSLTLHNERLFESFSERYLHTVEGLARSLDARRAHTRSHHQRVSRVAEALAWAAKLPADERHAIRDAGLVHDVGMAGVIGVEGGAESDMDHPSVGARMLERLPLHPAVAAGISAHHEWWDGWGFPNGLKGEGIPVAGRIMGLAEFLVEMATGDPVRAPWDADRLAEELRQRSGSQFEPELAELAVASLGDGRLPLEYGIEEEG